jgi:hypothetical protein
MYVPVKDAAGAAYVCNLQSLQEIQAEIAAAFAWQAFAEMNSFHSSQ